MIQVYSLRDKPFPEASGVWLAIKADGTHVGIAFLIAGNAPMFLHLAFHHDLRCEVADRDAFKLRYALLTLAGFSAAEQLEMAVWFEALGRENEDLVPYGLIFSGGGYFDKASKEFVRSDTGVGLTCATFVMTLFSDFGFPIVDWATWPVRPDDAGFQQNIVDALQQQVDAGFASQEHVDAQMAAIGTAARYRPVEVVASGGAYLGDMVAFPTAELLGKHLAADLQRVVF